MPYRVRKVGEEYAIQKKEDGSWVTVGKSSTRERAIASMRAREAAKK